MSTQTNEYVFSPSSLVEWEKAYKCVAKWHAYWVKREFKRPDTVATRLGRYFEYLCLGKSEHDHNPVTTAERGAGGHIPIAYVRAAEQAEIFKNVFTPGHKDYINEKIIDRHVKITSSGALTPKKRGIIDFITESQITGEITIWDLKCVESSVSTYGPQPWGDIRMIDPIQLGTYKLIYEELYGRKVNTNYMLFEHGPLKRRKIIGLNIVPTTQKEIDLRYDEAYDNFELAKAANFEVWTPSIPACNSCPLTCDRRMTYDPDEFVD